MHMVENDHRFDFSDTRVISHFSAKGACLMREALHSQETAIYRYIDLHTPYQALRTNIAKQEKQTQTISNSP